jgi:hypothetical protein
MSIDSKFQIAVLERVRDRIDADINEMRKSINFYGSEDFDEAILKSAEECVYYDIGTSGLIVDMLHSELKVGSVFITGGSLYRVKHQGFYQNDVSLYHYCSGIGHKDTLAVYEHNIKGGHFKIKLLDGYCIIWNKVEVFEGD